MIAIPFRIGHGYDVHALGDGLELWLGGVRIPHTKGCIAHSDGDVAIHALCDAMLGALALGDIGKHFPDTSDEFKGIDSKILLSRVNGLIAAQGYSVVNADITIAAQRPKLAPYIAQMRQTVADILGVDVSQVSVKATTTEHLGFTGREEGIAVWASVLLNCTDGGDMQRSK
ncbi:MAG TPA: 2-C-methyl-D-erythritol 2,4-cyclodiphosphate synthase [Candidatus Coprenecus pullistercoris]|nr:2-C-methyl-D-erythritol 2,4-cyclodiphosphate synthase [Candidatus Coprenecus pullistercoris]